MKHSKVSHFGYRVLLEFWYTHGSGGRLQVEQYIDLPSVPVDQYIIIYTTHIPPLCQGIAMVILITGE